MVQWWPNDQNWCLLVVLVILLGIWQDTTLKPLEIIVESFYNVKYWKSIITSNIRQINLSDENIKYKHCCFQISKIVSSKNNFGTLIYVLSWKHLFEIYFRLLRRNNKLKINNFLTNIWRNDWFFNIWLRKRTLL